MEIIKMSEIAGTKNHRGIMSKKLIQHQHTTVMNLILQPEESIPEHSVGVDVFFYVVSGKGTIHIGEEKAKVVEKDIVLCPANTSMALQADQGEGFEVLNVKTPSIKY